MNISTSEYFPLFLYLPFLRTVKTLSLVRQIKNLLFKVAKAKKVLKSQLDSTTMCKTLCPKPD